LDKSPDAFRTISEVADEIEVPQHVLRFWESRFAQIKPMKRGGGRRYYRPDDVDLLRGVRHLLYGEGYTIRGVQRILREQGSAFVQNVWRAGAEPPPPLLEEDRDEAAEAAFESRPEPKLPPLPRAALGTAAIPTEPKLDVAGPAAQSGRLAAAVEDKLRAAVGELMECRRLIDAALSGSDPTDGVGRSAEI
jgi:DNA-binding transcriptional MerR regulator